MKLLKPFIIILGLLGLIFSGLSAPVNAIPAENLKQDEISKKYGFTLEEEKEIGFQSSISLIKKYGQYKNKNVTKYVTDIGEGIARKVSKRPEIKYRFIILDTDDVNAFAAPGGFIFITKGSLKILYNEAELAAILGHEIAHVENGNGIETISGDPEIKEKIKALKQTVTLNEGLSQNFEELLDKELNKSNKKYLPIINFDNIKSLNNIKIK